MLKLALWGRITPHIKSGLMNGYARSSQSSQLLNDVLGRKPRIFQVYEEVKDPENLQNVVEDYLGEYNAESKQPMQLVMFADAIDHVARISRVIRCSDGSTIAVLATAVPSFGLVCVACP